MQSLQKPSTATAVHSTHSGPGKVSGGVPSPLSPWRRPNPDEIYEEDKKDRLDARSDLVEDAKDRAKPDDEEKKAKSVKDAVSNTATIAKTKAKFVAAKAQNVAEDAIRAALAKKEQKGFDKAFPGRQGQETVKATFGCRYIDGRSEAHKGDLVVTDKSVGFVGKGARERVPYRELASFEQTGMPVRLHLYTVANRTLQFVEVSANAPGHSDEPPYSVAMNWIDHMWRAAAQVPNPAAAYHES